MNLVSDHRASLSLDHGLSKIPHVHPLSHIPDTLLTHYSNMEDTRGLGKGTFFKLFGEYTFKLTAFLYNC